MIDLSDFVRRDHVFADVAPTAKASLLHRVAKVASEATGLGEGHILSMLRSREKLGSTGIGEGIALPHARLAELEKPFGMLLRLRKPVDFDAIDGRPTDIVFALLMPDDADRDHLNVLACVARRLRSSQVTDRIRNAEDQDELYRLLVDPSGRSIGVQ